MTNPDPAESPAVPPTPPVAAEPGERHVFRIEVSGCGVMIVGAGTREFIARNLRWAADCCDGGPAGAVPDTPPAPDPARALLAEILSIVNRHRGSVDSANQAMEEIEAACSASIDQARAVPDTGRPTGSPAARYCEACTHEVSSWHDEDGFCLVAGCPCDAVQVPPAAVPSPDTGQPTASCRVLLRQVDEIRLLHVEPGEEAAAEHIAVVIERHALHAAGSPDTGQAREPDADAITLVRRPGRMSGRVTIGYSRLPVTTILEYLAAGDSAELIANAYPSVTAEQIRVLDQLRTDLADDAVPPPDTGQAREPAITFDDEVSWLGRRYVDALNAVLCAPPGSNDVDRWRGHAEAYRQVAEQICRDLNRPAPPFGSEEWRASNGLYSEEYLAELREIVRRAGGPPGDTVQARPHTPPAATSWIAQALDDPAANGVITVRAAEAVFAMVRRYDATGIGWGGDRSGDTVQAPAGPPPGYWDESGSTSPVIDWTPVQAPDVASSLSDREACGAAADRFAVMADALDAAGSRELAWTLRVWVEGLRLGQPSFWGPAARALLGTDTTPEAGRG